MAMMIVIYPTPKDTDAFERHYFDTHIPLARTIPGLRSYEINAGPVVTPVGNPNIHRIGVLRFDDFAAIETAFASPQGQAAGADRRIFAPDHCGVQMFLFDTQDA